MKKMAVLGMGVCIVLAFSSCKSSESAYKKAYEKAKQQELAELYFISARHDRTQSAAVSVL